MKTLSDIFFALKEVSLKDDTTTECLSSFV